MKYIRNVLRVRRKTIGLLFCYSAYIYVLVQDFCPKEDQNTLGKLSAAEPQKVKTKSAKSQPKESNQSFIKGKRTQYPTKPVPKETLRTDEHSPMTSFNNEYVHKGTWQRVGSPMKDGNSTFVFSAYHDSYEPDTIKVIGLCVLRETQPYFCHVWYPGADGVNVDRKITTASTFMIDEKDKNSNVPCYIYCKLTDDRTPSFVSVLLGDVVAYNKLEVTYIPKKEYTRTFTMCLSPIFNFDDPNRLVEYIEFNSVLGANHFVIYYFSASTDVQNVLEFYAQRGNITIVQWPLEMITVRNKVVLHLNLFYHGQIAAYNDCLLRSKADSKFVVVTDMDEFIVPHLHGTRTWNDLLEHFPPGIGYKFRHCFFPLVFKPATFDYEVKEAAKQYKLKTLQHFERYELINDFVLRGKYMARTATAYNIHNHNVRSYEWIQRMDPIFAILHHYRKYVDMTPGSLQHNAATLEDRTVLDKYGNELIQRVVAAWSGIRNKYNILP